MFVPAEEQFSLSQETRATLRAAPHAAGAVARRGKQLLEAARLIRQKIRKQWGDFTPGPPQLAVKRYFDVKVDDWVEEAVMIQIDSQPFGRGAVRECFRMKEVRLDTRAVSGDASGTGGYNEGSATAPISGGAKEATRRFSFQAVASGLLELPSDRRSIWVAKRSIVDHKRKFLHRRACQIDVVHQTMAKHYAELFNSAVHRASKTLGRCGAHDVDFLLTHVVELAAGQTYGAEAFVLGEYKKHNNNGGATIGCRTTPQAFSYFTFIKSNRRLMIVDIQGVGDLYTDPVVHFLPSQVSGALANADVELNFGLRGFALFLWSHRRNDIDRMLNLPAFALSPHEERYIAPRGSATVSQLVATASKPRLKADEKDRQEDGATANIKIRLSEIPGVDLSDWCDWKAAVPRTAALAQQEASVLDLVEAECHMEIAGMYSEGRITLRPDEPRGAPGRAEVEAAVFHLVEAARQDLPEALLALARLTSDKAHDSFLHQVEASPEHRKICLAVLSRAASLQSSVAMGALARLVLDGTYSAKGAEELRAVAEHLEAFAEEELLVVEAKLAKISAKLSARAAKAAREQSQDSESSEEEDEEETDDLEQEHSCLHKHTFGWEDHGWRPHTALARAAELCAGDTVRAEALKGRAAGARELEEELVRQEEACSA